MLLSAKRLIEFSDIHRCQACRVVRNLLSQIFTFFQATVSQEVHRKYTALELCTQNAKQPSQFELRVRLP